MGLRLSRLSRDHAHARRWRHLPAGNGHAAIRIPHAASREVGQPSTCACLVRPQSHNAVALRSSLPLQPGFRTQLRRRRARRTSRRILEAWVRWFCHLRCAFSGSDYLEDGGLRLSIRCERHGATRVETLWGACQLEANRGRGRLCAAHVGDGGGGIVEVGKISFDSSAAAGPASICSIPGRKREVFLQRV